MPPAGSRRSNEWIFFPCISRVPWAISTTVKIKTIETFLVPPRSALVKVHTESDIVGWGECTLESRAKTTCTAVEELSRKLIGQDARRIEHLWQMMYRGSFYRGGPILCSAISGIEQALWDIKGKALQQPVWQLLGGKCRDRIRIYKHVGGGTLDALRKSCEKAVAEGFTAVKSSPVPGAMELAAGAGEIKKAAAHVRAMREAIGDDVYLMLDFHGRVSPSNAIQICAAIEEYRPFFVEEPCLQENVDTMARIARTTKIPIATGERLFTKYGFREVLEKQAAAILQPDVSHAGGILECKKIAAMAEAYYVGIAPHCPLSAIAFAACLQLDACTPNFVVQEQINLGEGLLKNAFRQKNGFVDVPTGDGLGIEVDEKALKKGQWKDWDVPDLHHADGGYADW